MKSLVTAVALQAILLSAYLPLTAASAAPSSQDLVSAIEKAKVLSTGTRVAASVNGAEAYVSTYRNARATDDDCKIEAILVAKTIMDLAPADISRVTVYFYNALRLNKRKEVAVTAGDVKAFGAGQLSQEQLLASIAIKDTELNDPAARLSAYLQQRESARTRKKIDTYMNGETMEVVADLDPDMSERDVKYEALRIAEKAMEKAGAKTARVKVSFADPIAKGNFKEISFDTAQLVSYDKNLQSALYNIQINPVTAKIDIQALEVVDGAAKDERGLVLKKLQGLDKQGVGIGPFIKQFFDIEQMVSNGNDDQATEAVKKLTVSVQEQEARTKGAKAPKPVAATAASGTVLPVAIVYEKDGGYRGRNPDGLGGGWSPEDMVKAPEQYVKEKEGMLGGKESADANPNFSKTLSWLYWNLVKNGKTAEAEKYGRRWMANQARYRFPLPKQ